MPCWPKASKTSTSSGIVICCINVDCPAGSL